VRFAARLGFAIDPATRDAIVRHAAELRGVSRERIGDELRRMLVHPSRAAAVALIERLTLDAPVLNQSPSPGVAGSDVLLAAMAAEPSRSEGLPFAAYLAAWAIAREGRASMSGGVREPRAAEIVRAWRQALCLSNDETEQLADILRTHASLASHWDSMRIWERKRTVVHPVFQASLAILAATSPGSAERILSDINALQSDGVGLNPDPLITGEDLIASGYSPGPLFKRILDEVRNAQLEGRIATKAAAMELARGLRV
jgi:poly(A) polymerase